MTGPKSIDRVARRENVDREEAKRILEELREAGFVWNSNTALNHHCAICQTPLTNPRTVVACIRNGHVGPCTGYHQTLHRLGTAERCNTCNKEDAAHEKVHKQILALLTIYTSAGQITKTSKPRKKRHTKSRSRSRSKSAERNQRLRKKLNLHELEEVMHGVEADMSAGKIVVLLLDYCYTDPSAADLISVQRLIEEDLDAQSKRHREYIKRRNAYCRFAGVKLEDLDDAGPPSKISESGESSATGSNAQDSETSTAATCCDDDDDILGGDKPSGFDGKADTRGQKPRVKPPEKYKPVTLTLRIVEKKPTKVRRVVPAPSCKDVARWDQTSMAPNVAEKNLAASRPFPREFAGQGADEVPTPITAKVEDTVVHPVLPATPADQCHDKKVVEAPPEVSDTSVIDTSVTDLEEVRKQRLKEKAKEKKARQARRRQEKKESEEVNKAEEERLMKRIRRKQDEAMKKMEQAEKARLQRERICREKEEVAKAAVFARPKRDWIQWAENKTIGDVAGLDDSLELINWCGLEGLIDLIGDYPPPDGNEAEQKLWYTMHALLGYSLWTTMKEAVERGHEPWRATLTKMELSELKLWSIYVDAFLCWEHSKSYQSWIFQDEHLPILHDESTDDLFKDAFELSEIHLLRFMRRWSRNTVDETAASFSRAIEMHFFGTSVNAHVRAIHDEHGQQLCGGTCRKEGEKLWEFLAEKVCKPFSRRQYKVTGPKLSREWFDLTDELQLGGLGSGLLAERRVGRMMMRVGFGIQRERAPPRGRPT